MRRPERHVGGLTERLVLARVLRALLRERRRCWRRCSVQRDGWTAAANILRKEVRA